ncbi:MAG: hypothetical protein ACR2RA_10270 [Geminicoccaceae bacterium]
MALAWCDAALSAEPTPTSLAFGVLGTCTTTFDDMTYTLQTVRLLMPSAHSLWCSPSPLEVQFIHEAECGNRLMLAALFREGEPNPDVHAALTSLLSGRMPVRLIDLVPLCRTFFVHDASHPERGKQAREMHMISAAEMSISSEQLAHLRAR